MKRSTCPPVSTKRWSPVKYGWHFEHRSTRMFALVDRVVNVFPHAQCTVVSTYSGWIPVFMVLCFFRGALRACPGAWLDDWRTLQRRARVHADALMLFGMVLELHVAVDQRE